MEQGIPYKERLKQLNEERIQKNKERRRNRFIIFVLGLVIIYWLFFRDSSNKTTYYAKTEPQQQAIQSSFVDSASNALQRRLERPDTYQLVGYRDAIRVNENSFRVFIKFRFKDWKEQYNVVEARIWLDSNKHIQEVRVDSLY